MLCKSQYVFDEGIILNAEATSVLSACLVNGPVTITAHDVVINGSVSWLSVNTLTIISRHHITFTDTAKIHCSGGGITLKAGIEDPTGQGNVIFSSPRTIIADKCQVTVHYNPVLDEDECKYYSPQHYREYIVSSAYYIDTYMLINDADDLANMQCMFHVNYALSRDIDLGGMDFAPIRVTQPIKKFFSGRFDGNNFAISNWQSPLVSDYDDMGLFGIIWAREHDPAVISNLILRNFSVNGGTRTGALAGSLVFVNVINVHLDNVTVTGSSVIGGIAGSVEYSLLKNISTTNVIVNTFVEYSGIIAGAIRNSHVDDLTTVGFHIEDNERELAALRLDLAIRAWQYILA